MEYSIDISGRVPIEGSHHVSTWVFPPLNVEEGPVPLLFCLPGGSYTKAYWHLEVPGHPGYSFAEHLAAQGLLVVAVDHLGVGESSRHPRAIELTPDVIAAANSAALATVVEQATAGSLVEGLGPIELGPVVGVGHSMGAMLAIFQQSLFTDFDAIAPLGYGVLGAWAEAHGIGRLDYETVIDIARKGLFDNPSAPERNDDMRRHFYWDDVPAEVIAADELTVTQVPGVTGPLSIVPFIAADRAGQITCPVFIGLSERDSTLNAHAEPGGYTASNDVTLFVLGESAHCHNTAGSRHALWDRLARWVGQLG